MIIDHIGVPVRDYQRSKEFYAKALAPLGITVIAEYGEWGGLGADGRAQFWFGVGAPSAPLHLALVAETRAQVDAFYAEAIAAGGKDNGGPGLRPEYHPDYYGAFVFDPDGNNLEAVCRTPEP